MTRRSGLVLLFLSCLGAGGTKLASCQETQGVVRAEEALARMAEQGIRVDPERREVWVPGHLLRDHPDPANPVELFLIAPNGAAHEALGVVDATPSLINFALLLIGLEPGTTREAVAKDPAPDERSLELGIDLWFDLVPPKGERIYCYVRWIDAAGNEQLHPVEDLLLDLVNGEQLPVRGFVYLGSRMIEMSDGGRRVQRFVADVEGNVATIYPTKISAVNCLFDVYCTDLEPYQLVDVDPDRVPPAGTHLEFLFTPVFRDHGRPQAAVSEPAFPVPAPQTFQELSIGPVLREADPDLLQRIGPRDRGELMRMARSAHVSVREIAVATLAFVDGKEAEQSLTLALRFDRSADVRLAAAFALVERGGVVARDALLDVLERSWTEPSDTALFALRLWSGQDFGHDVAAWRAWFADEARTAPLRRSAR